MAVLLVRKGAKLWLHLSMGNLLGALALMSGCNAGSNGNTFGAPGISISAISMSLQGLSAAAAAQRRR